MLLVVEDSENRGKGNVFMKARRAVVKEAELSMKGTQGHLVFWMNGYVYCMDKLVV